MGVNRREQVYPSQWGWGLEFVVLLWLMLSINSDLPPYIVAVLPSPPWQSGL